MVRPISLSRLTGSQDKKWGLRNVNYLSGQSIEILPFPTSSLPFAFSLITSWAAQVAW